MEMGNVSDLTTKPNSVSSNCSVDTGYRFTFYQVSYGFIFLLGLATNGMAFRKLCSTSRAKNSTAVYMASLSIADFIFVMSLPMRIYFYNQKARALSSEIVDPSSWPGAVYCQMTFILKYISLYGGIFFLVCIAVDRYLAVVHPLASPLRRLRIAQVLSGGIWCLVLGLSVGLPLLHSAAAHQDKTCLLDPSSQQHKTIILVALGIVLGSFLLPTLILLYSYCRVLGVLRNSKQRNRNNRYSRRHTLRVIYWVLGIYLLCFLPYHINLLGYTLTHLKLITHCGLAKVTKAAHPVVLCLASLNSCLNPLIYCFSSSQVHKKVPAGGGSGSQ